MFLGVQNLFADDNDKVFEKMASKVIMHSVQSLSSKHFLRQLYTDLSYVPIWMKKNSLSLEAQELLLYILRDKTLPEDSKLKEDALNLFQKSQKIYASEDTLKPKIALEFKISQLYKGYADYCLYGSIDWSAFQKSLYQLQSKNIKAAWETYTPTYTPKSLLLEALALGSLEKVWNKTIPQEYHFKALENYLKKYLKLQQKGEWKKLPLKGRLLIGKRYKVVPALRERLRLSGDYMGCAKESDVYNQCLNDAVKHFQKRHGLRAKGIIGKRTIAALNVPLYKRIQQIRLNLDRIKWLRERHSKYHIIINIPAFTLFFEENGTLMQQIKVIVGRPTKPTPIFSNTVTSIVLNPYWNIPKSIIQKEMIPKLLKNPNAMAKNGIEIHEGWGKDAPKIDAASVDWNEYRYSKVMPFHFAQVPGYKNALGKVKFLFPNKFSVYMHDTPNKRLFHKQIRAFSHGCIRLQKPRELLKTFSAFNDSVDFKKAQKRLRGRKKAYLKLDRQVPVDIVYLTAYVDYDGLLNFRDDIYGYDRMQLHSYRHW